MLHQKVDLEAVSLLLNQLIQGLVKDGSLIGWQPELRIIDKAHGCLLPVEVVVHFDVVSFVPFSQGIIRLFHHVMHDPSVG